GISTGDRVVVQVEKSPQAIAAYLATLQVGGVYVPLNTAYTDAELRYFLDDAEPAVLIVDPGRAEQTRKLAPESAVLTLDRHGNGSLLASESRRTTVDPVHGAHAAAILYTSGTTGRSKGAVLTHEN